MRSPGMDRLLEKEQIGKLKAISFILLIMGKRAGEERSRFSKCIATVGGLTFGIYLLDPIVGNLLKPLIIGTQRSDVMLLLMSFVYCIVSMFICGVITFLFKKIRLLRLSSAFSIL